MSSAQPIVFVGYTYECVPHDAYAIDLSLPLMPQIVPIAEFPAVILDAEEMDGRFRRGIKEVQEGYLVAQIASNTVNRNLTEGAYNSVYNHDAVLAAGRLEDSPEPMMTIVGNGESKDEVGRDFSVVMSCWHAMPTLLENRIPVDYVAHIDAICPRIYGNPPAGAQLIATPTTAKDFWKFDNDYLLYIDPAPECKAWVEILQIQHPKVDGSVVHMMTHSAILMGAKEIIFYGLEFGFRTLEEAAASGYEGFYEKPNKAGQTWYTTRVLELFKDGIEKIVALYPEVEFINHSVGLPIKGIDN